MKRRPTWWFWTRASLLERDIPPMAYGLMHAHARLSDADRERLASPLAETLGLRSSHEAGEYDR